MGFFIKRDYTTAKVIREETYDECNVLKHTEFYIEYNSTFLWVFKYKEKFFEWNCGWGDCVETTIRSVDMQVVLDKFSEFLVNNRKTVHIKTTVKEVEDLKC